MSNTYLVRERRPLFYTDPSSPSSHRQGNRWAEPGQYVVIDHPFLEAIIKTQRQKVRLIPEGQAIPHDAIVISTVDNPFIKAQMKKYDRVIAKRKPEAAVAAAAKVVVEEATERPSGETPALVLDDVKPAVKDPNPDPVPTVTEPQLEEIKPSSPGEGTTLERIKSERKGK